jgi:tetratricopeptide (TPR) repeat protein
MQRPQIPKWLRQALGLLLATGLFCAFSLSAYAQTVKDVHGKKEEASEQTEVATDKSGEELSKEASKALFEAQELMKNDDFAGGRKFLLDFLATDPDPIPIVLFHMLGYSYSSEGNMEEARKVFKQGYEAAPDDENLLLNYAIATWEVEKFADAAPLFELIYATGEKKDSKFLQQAAAAWYQDENFLEAKRVLKQMLALPEKPKPDWYQMIINICMEMEQMDEAEDYVLEYLRFDPLKAEYWRLLAQFRLDGDDYRSAAGALEISYVIKSPAKNKNWEDLADLYAYLNAPLKVAGTLVNALKGVKENDPKFLQLVEFYARAQRFDTAIDFLDKMIAVEKTAKLFLEKGKIEYDAGRTRKAIKAWGDCIEADSKEGDCRILKGFAEWDLKDWDDARETFEGALALDKYRLQAEDAIAVLEDLEAAKYDPDSPDNPK